VTPDRYRAVVLGVCGSSAATIAAELVDALLADFTDEVRVVVTEHARPFVPRLRVPVFRDKHWRGPVHVTLTEGADLFVVAPATAHTLGKLAHGLADNLLTSAVLATDVPVLAFPAMNMRMWRKPSVRRNVATLREDGIAVVEPDLATAASSDRHGDAVGFDTDFFVKRLREVA
jgi:phosphopantothenoylcysteine synthetase/decarboxylase